MLLAGGPSPGALGFLVFVIFIVVAIVLFVAMTRSMRRMRQHVDQGEFGEPTDGGPTPPGRSDGV